MPQMSQVLRERAIGMLTAGMPTRAVAREFNVHLSTISRLQRRFREFGSTSTRPHNRRPRVTTPAQDLHIQHTQGYGMGRHMLWTNEHGCILLMAFWMHKDTMMRSWGSSLCHSSTTITSCSSMVMHSPMLQGSVHNSWKLKTSQFLHGQRTHRTCHPLSMFGMLWIGVFDSVF